MTRRLVAFLVAVACFASVGAMRSDRAWRLRKAQKSIAERLEFQDRFVDYGIRLIVVKSDPNGETLIPAKPALKFARLREHTRGGTWDTTEKRWVGASAEPLTWLVDEVGEPVILHGNDLPPNLLVEGSMGGGKSVLTIQWAVLRCLEQAGTGGDMGFTIPTGGRGENVLREFRELTRPEWFAWSERKQIASFRCDVRLQFISTHNSGKSTGSRIQGQSWFAAASEEMQDCVDEDSNIHARGRDGAALGRFRRLVNATVKDFPKYRSWKNRILAARRYEAGDDNEKPTGPLLWKHVRKLGIDSPFVPESWWRELRGQMTEEDYRRKVGVEDLPSEARVYYAFDRRRNVMPIPAVGAKDVTARELGRFGPGYGFLLAHDPGRIWDVTEVMKAYELPIGVRLGWLEADLRARRPAGPDLENEVRGIHRMTEAQRVAMGLADPVWFVVGEISTKRSSSDAHVRAVMHLMKDRFGISGQPASCFVKADPFTKTHRDDEQPHISVYRIWQSHGYRIQAAAYRPAKPGHQPEAALIPVEARIDMMNSLLFNADGVTRLCVAQNDRGELLAPKLVEGFEGLEKDQFGYAERGRKDDTDVTHWPCAVGYGLWSIESSRFNQRRQAG